jgi:hypothetical protein
MVRRLCSLLVLFAPEFAVAQGPTLERVADEVRQEAVRSNQDPTGRPLPLAGHWTARGANREGFTPTYQLRMLAEGHHLLPWLDWPPTDEMLKATFKTDAQRQKYIDDRVKEYEPVVKELARLRLPISFFATQWESNLTYNKRYFDLPPEKNPNVIDLDGKVLREVSPFGPVEPWHEVGRSWTDNLFMKRIQEWYPDTPLVLLISNNEHGKLQWTDVEKSKRYLENYGKGKPDAFKRKVVGDGWIERYGALLDGVRSGLASEIWRKRARLVGYEAFPPVHLGRWDGWKVYSLVAPGRLDPQPLVWDGGSPSYYLHNWMAITDFTLWSPQIETMNWVFMLEEIFKTRPEFWFELSTWDGDQPGASNDKRKFYARLGQPFSPARYEGFVQYGMWLMRPRVVREFRGYLETVEYAGPYFQPILNAVDRVYQDPVLQKFWRKGTLLKNPRGKHPYQADVPPEYRDAARWFLLDTSLTPRELAPTEFDNAQPPARQMEIPVFALALELGSAPQRQWLVYTHAPQQARTGVTITVPGFGDITVDVPQSGSFFHLTEKGQSVKPVIKGGPPSFRLQAPSFVEVGSPVTFAVSEKYNPEGRIESIRWDFGDGAISSGDRVLHKFAKKGQYLVTATGSENGKQLTSEQVPVFACLKPHEGLVCRLLMEGALRKGMTSWIWLGGWDKVHYHFIPDASGANNLGFLAGGSWVQDEQRGTVLRLDGRHDRVEINNSPDLNTGKEYRNRTIAFWFRPEAAEQPAPAGKGPKPRQVLFEEGGPGAGFNVYLDGSELYGGAWQQGKGTWLHKAITEPKTWHHAALVLRTADGAARGQLELYLDGQRVAEGEAPVIGAHTADINIGRCGSTLFHDGKAVQQPAHYFAGRIGEFRILNKPLAAKAIQELAEPR